MAPKPKSSSVGNDELQHTAGGVTTRDGMDAGVPMTPGQPDEPIGPEDALGPGLKRGDYRDRIDSGPHMVTRAIPEDERRERAEKIAADSDGTLTAIEALAEVPTSELVDQSEAAGEVGDAPGKGGVSTEAAQEASSPAAPASSGDAS